MSRVPGGRLGGMINNSSSASLWRGWYLYTCQLWTLAFTAAACAVGGCNEWKAHKALVPSLWELQNRAECEELPWATKIQEAESWCVWSASWQCGNWGVLPLQLLLSILLSSRTCSEISHCWKARLCCRHLLGVSKRVLLAGRGFWKLLLLPPHSSRFAPLASEESRGECRHLFLWAVI